MSTRRSRRRSGAASVSDGPSGSEGPNERSATTSPIRRRSRQGASPRSLGSSQKELALRLLGQFSDIRSVFNQQRQENGEDTNGPDVLIEGAKCGDAKSDGEELMDLIDTATNADSNTVGDTQAAQSSEVSCDASKLLHIEVKVEDVAPDSLSITTYSEQQPSTSSAMTVSQSGVSLSRATPTPRSSIITGHESNVERAAKQEAQVLARVAELRRQGLWTTSRLPMIEMPARNKTHWDYLLEEMRWMAADFRQERTFKRHAAKKFATQIARIRKDKEQEEERSEQRAVKEAKRVCAMIAKMVRDFWLNVDKVVDFRAQEIIESMKRKALDQQLELMVGQADKLSEMVQEGLTEKASKAPSLAGDEDDDKDEDFAGMESESDDERTIAKAEAVMGTDVKEEVQQLEKEQNLELDDFLASLPAGYLESMGMGKASTSKVTEESINEPSEGETSEESSDDEEQNEDNDTSKEEVASASGEPPTKKKKPIDKVIEESSPVQSTDSMGRSVSSASVKESEMSTMPPSEEVSKDVPQGINFDLLNSENSEDRQNELANIAEEALKLQPKGFTLETTQVKTDVPPLIRGTLREYQLVGLDWLVTLYDKGLNGILADEMGLGKTIQTIALLAHLACKEAVWGPHLIVVPTSVILNWEMELKKWCPAFKILTYFGSQKERAEKRKGWSKPNMFHVCITSYKLVTQDIRIFKHKAWQYFILDEAQNIKNFKSQRWQALLNVRARRRLLLTGTPLQNSLMELWSLMHFLMPAIFASHNDFKDWFSNPLTDMMEGSAEWNAPLVQRLHKVLRPFILRRLKKEVEKQLPEKIEHVVKCSLSKRQRYLYDDFISQRTTRENLRSGSVFSVLNIVMQLRKCCNHPNLFEPRPVVSPFVMHPRTLTVPAMLVDICNSGTASGSRLRIPECLRLDHVMRGSHFAISETRLLSAKKPLIEEIGQHDAGPPMPKVDGFKFVRPPPPLRRPKHAELESMQASGNASAVSVPAGSVPQSGEYYVCVDNGTARVYQLVTSSCGERTIRECDPSMVAGSAGGSTPMVTTLEHPPAISLEVDPLTHKPVTNTQHMEVDMKSTVKTEMVEVIETPNDNTPLTAAELYKKAIERRAAFRTTTVLNKTTVRAGQTLKQEQVSVSNGCPTLSDGRQAIPAGTTIPYQSMGSPSRARCVAQVRPLTAAGLPLHRTITNGVASQGTLPSAPPKKRRKNVAPKIDRQPYAELILSETRSAQRERREACAQRIAQVCAQRTDWPNMRRAPLVSDELLSILINELKHKHRRKPKGPNSENVKCGPIELNGFECWEKLGWTHHKLRSWTEDMVERFTVYVHSALADAPRMSISSNGLSAYERQTTHNQVEHCRRLFQADDPLVSKCRTAQMVQFPELRLIEYDCGKLQVLSALLREMFLYKHRCLIFTQMSRMLDVLQAFLSFHGYQYFRLDGTTGIEQRQAMMERFNRDPKIFCFILSTRSGGVGVNLTGADTVIFYDSDWNPTMDAQAQDRCHRIGQTRNVNIYRLISERTIEENILKKAMQKRRLGELAIDEGGFTPEFFQEDNIKDLFEDEAAVADVIAPLTVSDAAEVEKAMATVEDQQDVAAAKRAKAEARAELAEFDENVQLRDNAEGQNSNDRADSKYFELISQLKPIERYAVNFLEVENKPDFEEEVKEAEAMIASKKDEWLKAHETVMEGGEEEEETDSEFDLTYANGFGVAGSVDEMICLEFPNEQMPLWTPLSPPVSDAEDDLYVDSCGDLWYERDIMSESRLPGVIHELHRPKPFLPTPLPLPQTPQHLLHPPTPRHTIDCILTSPNSSTMLSAAMSLQASMPSSPAVPSPTMGDLRNVPSSLHIAPHMSLNQERVNTVPLTGVSNGSPYLDTSNLLRPATPSRIPNSVDDAIDSVRKSAQKGSSFAGFGRYGSSSRSLFSDMRGTKSDMRRPLTPPPREREAIDYEGLDWNINDDYALLLAVARDQHLPYHLQSSKPGHIVNWDFVSQLLPRNVNFYRSPRQCSIHYQLMVQPREEGRMMTLDPVTKKSRKVPVGSLELMHMKRGRTTTEQQYNVDSLKLRSTLFMQKARALKMLAITRRQQLASRRPPASQRAWNMTADLPAKQLMKLLECGVRYNQLTAPSKLVNYRANRRTKLQEQDKERQKVKEEDERRKETAAAEQQNERDQKVHKRESAVPALPGVGTYQRITMAMIIEEMEEQQRKANTPVTSIGGTVPVATVRTMGISMQPGTMSSVSVPGQSSSAVVDSQQMTVGQRALSDHQQMASLPSLSAGVHHTGARRVQIPGSGGLQSQHQIVMTGNSQQSSSQQPYTVVVSSHDNILTGSSSQMGTTRMQYTSRQEGSAERQTIYRAIAPTAAKRTPPATPVQRVGMPVAYASTSGGQPTQIYSTSSHGGRALIVSQAGDTPTLSDQPHLQMMRPQLQPVGGTGVRQDSRTKIGQRTQNRVYLTTSGGERTYLMPQSQVRMLPSGQRITQKRAGGSLQGKTIGGQQQVTMMVPSRGGGIQQVRTVPGGTFRRNIGSGYQSSRMPSIGLIMSGGSGARNNETIGGSGTTRQLPPQGGLSHSRQLISTGGSQGPISRQLASITAQNAASSNTPSTASSSSAQPTMTTTFVRTIPASAAVLNQDNYTGPIPQQTQSLPPISLSTQSNAQSQRMNPRQNASQSVESTPASPLPQTSQASAVTTQPSPSPSTTSVSQSSS